MAIDALNLVKDVCRRGGIPLEGLRVQRFSARVLDLEIFRSGAPQPPRRQPHLLTMKTKFRQGKKPDDALRSLNAAIDTLDLARDNATLKSAKDSFHSTSALLTTIRVCFLTFHVLRLLTDICRTR